MAEEELRRAARDEDVETVRKLILAGTKQTANEDGETPLFLATTCYVTEPKYVEVVRELLDNGAEVNHANKAGDTAIHNTASLGNFETTEILIEYDADLELEGEAKMVPLGLAAMKKHHAIVTLIVNDLLESDKVTEKQLKWMFAATDANQQLTVYRALSSIIKIKKIIPKLVEFNLIGAICQGFKSFDKKGVTHALKLLTEVLETPEGLKAAKDKKIDALISEVIGKNEGDAVLKHLGDQVLGQIK